MADTTAFGNCEWVGSLRSDWSLHFSIEECGIYIEPFPSQLPRNLFITLSVGSLVVATFDIFLALASIVWQSGMCAYGLNVSVSGRCGHSKSKRSQRPLINDGLNDTEMRLIVRIQIQTHKSSKERYLLGQKHNLQIFRVVPFIKLNK